MPRTALTWIPSICPHVSTFSKISADEKFPLPPVRPVALRVFRTGGRHTVKTPLVMYSEVCWDTLLTIQGGCILLPAPDSRMQRAVELPEDREY